MGHSDQYGGFTFLLRYEDINEVTHRPEVFSSFPNSIPPVFVERPMVPLQVDPPAHHGYRTMLNPSFTPQRMAALEATVRSYAARLVESFMSRGRCDAFSEFSAPIPVYALSRLLSLPEEHYADFQQWAHSFVHESTSDPERSLASVQAMYALLGKLLAERREHPLPNDLLSEIAAGEVNGRPVSDQDALDICLVLVVAGIDTTQNALANSLLLLGRRPDLRRQLIDRPDLMASAVEEFLRFDGPVQSTARTVKAECSVTNADFQEGDSVLLVWAAANRDPDEFPDPDAVVLAREPNRHFAFGAGIHRCLGAHLARLELRVGLEEFLKRIPEYEVADELTDPDKWITGIVRGPKTLPLTYPV